MPRLKIEDIMKPGTKMFTGKVDTNDPKIKKMFEQCRRRQLQLKKLQKEPFINYLITI